MGPIEGSGKPPFEFEPADPDDPYDMDFANNLARWILVGFVIFGVLAGAVLWLRLPG